MDEQVIFTGLKVTADVPLVLGDEAKVGDRRRAGELLSAADVAKLCGVSASRVYVRLRRGVLPERKKKVGAYWFWTRDQLPDLFREMGKKVKWKRPLRTTKLSADEQQELVSLRSCGFTQKELAEFFPLTQSQISRTLRRLEKPGG